MKVYAEHCCHVEAAIVDTTVFSSAHSGFLLLLTLLLTLLFFALLLILLLNDIHLLFYSQPLAHSTFCLHQRYKNQCYRDDDSASSVFHLPNHPRGPRRIGCNPRPECTWRDVESNALRPLVSIRTTSPSAFYMASHASGRALHASVHVSSSQLGSGRRRTLAS